MKGKDIERWRFEEFIEMLVEEIHMHIELTKGQEERIEKEINRVARLWWNDL